MSDKDDNVEMSVDITADDIPAVVNSNSTSEQEPDNNSPNSDDNLPGSTNNNFPSCKDVSEEMGQLKSKLKKLREKKKESDEEESEELEIELDDGNADFMCGVVEGFYGRPWTTAQRKELFRRMQSMGMNTYLYGPKDDYKHRLCWRDLYSEDETALMKILIESAAEQDVLFIYAISPGLDMSFASEKELECLKNKLLQVQSLGCKAFALLFDDIDPILRAPDKMQFSSAASAQATVTNQMHDLLGRPKFLFCPTEYCNSMACPDVSSSKYLKTIGKELNRNISVMWTGPKVVSKCISVESIKELTRVVRRKVVIWDNIHANDYDPKRVFLGPYKGRSTELIPHLAGVLTNPNCEFESNYIAMHTLSSWWKSHVIKPTQTEVDKSDEQDKKSDVEMESEGKKTDSEDIEEQKENTENQEKLEERVEEEPEQKEEAEIMIEKDEKPPIEEAEKENDSQQAEEKKENLLEDPSPSEANIAEAAAPSSSPMSSASSSALGSDSDTDSDYSSHDEYYYRRHSPPFDHGTYDPEESLREAIKNWLPYFSASRLSLGKPIPRSGPPLGMVSQCDVSLMTSAQMGPMSSTTSALPTDPISSTPFKYGSPGHTPNIEIKTEGEKDTKDSAGNTDVEMAGSTPPSVTQTTGGASDLDEKPPADVDMKSDQEKEEKMQMGDLEEIHQPKMETEEEETMQYEADPDSDVSMATTNSGTGKKTLKEGNKDDGRDRSVSGSTVDMATPPHQPSSSCEQSLEATPEHRVDDEPAPPLYKMDQMTLQDVELAVELFYLPYEHGVVGKKMVQEFVWLQCNVRQASAAPKTFSKSEKNENLDKALEWMERAIQFEDSCTAIRRMCNKLTSCSNRALLYDLFPYFWDMKGVVSMLSSYVKWMGQFYLRHTSAKATVETGSNSNSKPGSPGSKPSSPQSLSSVPYTPPTGPWLGPDPESWVFKGGLSGELQRLLPVTMANDLFYQAIPCTPQTSNSTYVIRPYLLADEKSVYKICLSTGNDGTDFADDFTGYEDLPGERLVGGLLTLSPEYCFVVEDEIGICGYLVGAANARSFWKKYSVAFLPEVKEKYSLPKEDENAETSGKLGEEVRRLLEEICSEDPPDAYAMDNLYTSHPAYMQIAVHRRASDPSIAKSMTVCMLSALKSHGVHGVHTTVRSSDCYMPDLYCRLGFHEIRPIDPSPVTPAPSSTYKDDTFIVFGRTF